MPTDMGFLLFFVIFFELPRDKPYVLRTGATVQTLCVCVHNAFGRFQFQNYVPCNSPVRRRLVWAGRWRKFQNEALIHACPGCLISEICSSSWIFEWLTLAKAPYICRKSDSEKKQLERYTAQWGQSANLEIAQKSDKDKRQENFSRKRRDYDSFILCCQIHNTRSVFIEKNIIERERTKKNLEVNRTLRVTGYFVTGKGVWIERE